MNTNYSGVTIGFPSQCKSYECNDNLNSNDPASQYQRLKIIQNTVRVPSSLYTMNLGALNVYQKPLPRYKVNWNQMSDRRERSYQPSIVTGGSTYHGSSTRHTITRNRPGASCPGGYGVDIKHNSYDRYLNRIKGKGPVRRGPIPADFGHPIVYNPAGQRVQGGKTMKTSIVNGCNCPDGKVNEALIYKTADTPFDYNIIINYAVGDYVYVYINDGGYYQKAIIDAIDGSMYTVMFDDGSISQVPLSNLFVYFPCNCNQPDLVISELINNNLITLDSTKAYLIDSCIKLDNKLTIDALIQFYSTNIFGSQIFSNNDNNNDYR
jgi:hypothetical protein